ncbi:helix-turn-helix domain-containing protein [Pseudomonas cavernae]|uniref:helix-turn-helix domain-containing protein n=1 Tax=Pseudomonas cavernae TaxID=2320867 RepID=UPI0013C4D570|nr:helix-turn-helix domain-containing protein [Pseudomonas cavernae]
MINKITMNDIHSVGALTVESSLLDGDKRAAFLLRREAVEQALDGVERSEISERTGISSSELSRYIARYTTLAPTGKYWGEAALIPNFRIKQYTRTLPVKGKRTEQRGGYSGALVATLKRYPQVHEEFIVHVLKKKQGLEDGIHFSKRSLASSFYKLLEDAGVTKDEWPFNILSMGIRTVYSYVQSILDSDFAQAAFALGGGNAKIHSKVGSGHERLLVPSEIFDVMQVDAWKIDGYFVLNIKPDRKVTTEDVVDRFWFNAAVDVYSGAIFSYKLCFSSETRAQDVIDVLSGAYTGSWRPLEEPEIPGVHYLSGAGLPGFLFPEIKNNLWGAIYLDNAMQHHSNNVKDLITKKLSFAVNYGQLQSPERRSIIENLFKQTASMFMHKIQSTTGSSPGRGRSGDPESNAVAYEVDVEEAIKLTDIFVANYNSMPKGGGSFSLSPLEILRCRLSDTNILRVNINSEDLVIGGLNSHSVNLTVRGSIEKGTRPYVQLDKVRYTSPKLSSRPSMIVTKLTVIVDPEDYRKVTAYLPSGVFFDELKALGPWGREKHSVMTRRLINRALSKKTFILNGGESVITAWRDHLESNKSKKNNLELLRQQKESDGGSDQSTALPEQLIDHDAEQENIEIFYDLPQVLMPGESV